MLDDIANPHLGHRLAARNLARLRRVLALALPVALAGNIALLVGVSEPELALLAGLRISLALCLATALGGALIGSFLAWLPAGPVPYLAKLPVATLGACVGLNAVLIVAQGVPMAFHLAFG